MLALALLLALDWAALLPTLQKSVPRVEMQKGEQTGLCSSVVFMVDADKYGHALTAGHCVARANEQERIDITVNGRTGVVTHSNGILDLAIVRFRAKDETTVTLAPMNPPMGTPVAIIGYGFGVQSLVAQFGHVAQSFNRESKSTWINADLLFGDSGGAAFDEQGRLVGINSRVYSTGPAHIGAVVSAEQIRDYLDAYEADLKKHAKK